MVAMLAKELSSYWVQEHVGGKIVLTCLKASISYQASKDWSEEAIPEELMAKTFPKLIKEDKHYKCQIPYQKKKEGGTPHLHRCSGNFWKSQRKA